MVTLCAPDTHRFFARNSNFASSGVSLIKLIVANSFGVFTPFNGMGGALFRVNAGRRIDPPRHARCRRT